MTVTLTSPDLAARAAARLARLEGCARIQPARAGDEDMRCANDSFALTFEHGHWQHSTAEISEMRRLADVGWPR